jgi:hypothetical protein
VPRANAERGLHVSLTLKDPKAKHHGLAQRMLEAHLVHLSAVVEPVLASTSDGTRETRPVPRASARHLMQAGDHEYACMHDLMMHLRDAPQARFSNVHDVFDI